MKGDTGCRFLKILNSTWRRNLTVILIVLSFVSSSVQDCSSSPCMYGICVDDPNGSYRCYCIDGYTGINCEINWDDCWSHPCLNGGTCNDGIASFNCTCTEGYVGSTCEQKYSECMNQPCLNNGTCLDYNGFTCQCQEGFSGEYCEIDALVCNNTMCRNGGECLEGPGLTYSCRCDEGWTGPFCEQDVDECVVYLPCQNDGLCINSPGTYTCACLFGFTGKDCDKRVTPCEENPCENKAVCLLEDDEHVCYCVPDYHGALCESRYDDCESKAAHCANGGSCVDGINSFSCACPEPYTGETCTDLLPSTTPSIPVTTTTESVTTTTGGSGDAEPEIVVEIVTEDVDDLDKSTHPSITTTTMTTMTLATTIASEDQKTNDTQKGAEVGTGRELVDLEVTSQRVDQVPEFIVTTTPTLTPAVTTMSGIEIGSSGQQTTMETADIVGFTTELPATRGPVGVDTHTKMIEKELTTVTTDRPTSTEEYPSRASSIITSTPSKSEVESTTVSRRYPDEDGTPSVPATTETSHVQQPWTSNATPDNDNPDLQIKSGTVTSNTTSTVTIVTHTNESVTVHPEPIPIDKEGEEEDDDEEEQPLVTSTTQPSSSRSIESRTSALEVTLFVVTDEPEIGKNVTSVTRPTDADSEETMSSNASSRPPITMMSTSVTPVTVMSVTAQTMGGSTEPTTGQPDFVPVTDFHRTTFGTELDQLSSASPPASVTTSSSISSSSATPTNEPMGFPKHGCNPEQCANTSLCIFNATQCDCSYKNNCKKPSSVKNAAFSGKSYLRQKFVIDDGTLNILVRLKTKAKSGILIHSLFDDERYALLYMEGGQLKFQFSCDLQTMLFGEWASPINNGREVDVEMRFHYIVGQNSDKCSARLLVNGTEAMNGEQFLVKHEDVPKSARLHLGGIPVALSHQFPQIVMGFVGCMSLLEVNGMRRDFIQDSVEAVHIEECNSFICLDNPCKNFGACEEDAGKIVCKCAPGFSGKFCERSICDDNPCHLGATCLVSPGVNFICICPLGTHGLFCEKDTTVVQPSFSVFSPGFSSYMAYGVTHSLKDNMELKMKIMPQTLEQISLIAYMGQSGSRRESFDHFSITYVRGYVMLTWDLGSGVRRIFTDTPLNIKARKIHTLRIGRRGRDSWLYVEGIGNVTGRAAGANTRLDVSPILYIGGHKSKYFETLPHDLPLHTGFIGCIYDIELRTDGNVFPITVSSPATGRGVGECHRNECSHHSCKNGAVCLNYGPSYSCICMKDWEGPDCSKPINCTSSDSLCHNSE